MRPAGKVKNKIRFSFWPGGGKLLPRRSLLRSIQIADQGHPDPSHDGDTLGHGSMFDPAIERLVDLEDNRVVHSGNGLSSFICLTSLCLPAGFACRKAAPSILIVSSMESRKPGGAGSVYKPREEIK